MRKKSILLAALALIPAFFSFALIPSYATDRQPMRPLCPAIALSDNNAPDSSPQLDNGSVVWQGYDGSDIEIYLWDGAEVTNLSDNDTDDWSPQIDDYRVVWQGDDGNDIEIYLWDGTGVTNLSNNDTDDADAQIDGGRVVWRGFDGRNYEIYLWDGVTTTQLSNNNNRDNWSPQIDGTRVVWRGYDGQDYEIYLWDGVTVTNLSDNREDDTAPQIDRHRVVWQGYDGQDYEIYLWDGVSATQLSDNNVNDWAPQIEGGRVVWHAYDGGDNEIYVWDGASVINLSDNFIDDNFPQITGGQIVWRGYDGSDWEIYLWDGASIANVSRNATNDANPQTENGLVVWQGGDSSDDEVWVADCSIYVTQPLDLEVTGNLTSPPILPTLHWTHQTSQTQIAAPAHRYRVVLLRDDETVLDSHIDPSTVCDNTACALPLSRVMPDWGLLNGIYTWGVAAVMEDESEVWSQGSLFGVDLPPAALPDPITVNPADGRIAIAFPDDPYTLWVQIWVGPHTSGNYFQWRVRDDVDAEAGFTCDGINCVIYPEWDVPTATDLTVWMQAWGPGGFSSGGAVSDAWNDSDPFDLPADPATLPSNIIIGGTPAEPGFGWTGGANATWYNLVLITVETPAVAHSSWHQASAANCPGALVNPPDYDCAIGWLGLADTLASNTDYDVFVRAWGPGGFSSGSDISGMDAYTQGGPFTYNP